MWDKIADKIVGHADKVCFIREGIFSVSWFFWFFSFPLQESTFGYPISVWVLPIRFFALFAVALCEITFLPRYKKLDWFGVLAICLLVFSALKSDNTILLQGMGMVFCARHYDRRHTLSTAASAIAFSSAIIVVSSLFGLINPGDWMATDGRGLRRSLGFVYPSRLPNYYLAIILAVMLTRKKLGEATLIALSIVAVALLALTGSRNPFLFTLVALAFYPMIHSHRVMSFAVRHRFAVSLVPVICVAGLFAVALAYSPDSPLLVRMDSLLSGRLHLSQTAIANNPVTLLGSSAFGQIEMANAKTGYFDSSYFRLVYYFGIIPAMLVIVSFCVMLYKSAASGNSRLLFVSIIAILHGMVEGQLFLLQYSSFLIFLISKANDIQIDARETDGTSKPKQLVIAQTPLQMLSADKYLKSVSDCDCCDLLILDKFEYLVDRFDTFKAANCIYYAQQCAPYPKKPIFYLLARELFAPKEAQRSISRECPGLLDAGKYDALVFSSATPLVHNLRSSVCREGFYSALIDDGIGSHIGTIYSGTSFFDDILSLDFWKSVKWGTARTWTRRLINLWFDGRLSFNVKSVHLFNPGSFERRKYAESIDVIPLQVERKRVGKRFSGMSESCASGYADKEIVLLLGPDDQGDSKKVVEDALLDVLLDYPCVIRRHPRGSLPQRKHGSNVYFDDASEPWEFLISDRTVTENQMLVGFASTAQWMPKLLINYEPFLMFLGDIINDEDPTDGALDELITEIEGSYHKVGRVLRPSCIEDCRKAFDAFRSSIWNGGQDV